MDNKNPFQVRMLDPVPTKPSFDMNRLLKWLLISAFVVAAVGVGFFLFSRSSFSPGNVDFKINAPEEISSGEKVVYSIEYRNNNEKTIKDLHLTFFYPPDAVDIRDGRLEALQTESMKLDDLAPGEENKIEFSAYLVGSRGDTKKARAVLSFYGEGIPSVFKKETSAATDISSLAVSLTLVAPPNAVSGQEVTYLLDYRNESSDDLSDLRFKFTYPSGFIPTKFFPNTFSVKDVLDLKKIKSGEGDRISITGILQGGEKDAKTISVTLQRKIDNVYIDFEKSSADTVISTPPLSVQIMVNERSDYNAQLGDELEYKIKFINNTDVDIFGLTLMAKLEGLMFDFSSVGGNGFFSSSTRTITWNASVSPLLNHLAPRQEGAVSFRVKIKNSFSSGGTGVKDYTVKTSVLAETQTIPPGFDLDRLSAESELITKIISLPSIVQKGFQNDQSFGASGPIPPRVGQKTSYTISWEIVNIPNDVSKARVSGTLPAGVQWENQTRVNGQQPAITFDSSSREVVWPLETIPAGTGGQFPKYQSWFLISFTPSENNLGQAIKLIQDTFLEGQDGFTRQDILVRVGDVSTNDLADFPGSGNVTE
ncbi:MAG: hypothetical protein Q8R34_02185 [bacterium]|nr:hypothetical protein [bacterium]